MLNIPLDALLHDAYALSLCAVARPVVLEAVVHIVDVLLVFEADVLLVKIVSRNKFFLEIKAVRKAAVETEHGSSENIEYDVLEQISGQ